MRGYYEQEHDECGPGGGGKNVDNFLHDFEAKFDLF